MRMKAGPRSGYIASRAASIFEGATVHARAFSAPEPEVIRLPPPSDLAPVVFDPHQRRD